MKKTWRVPPVGPNLIALALALAIAGCGKPSVEPASGAASTAKAPVSAGPTWRPGYIRPPVVDVHGHVLPSGVDGLTRVMTDNGLSRVVNLSGGVLGRGADKRVALEKRFPAMHHLLNVDWRMRARPGFGQYMARSLEVAVKRYGFKGLKISKALGLYLKDIDGVRIPVDWPELDPMWDMAGKLGVPVAIHTSDPKAFWLPVTPDNERYEELNAHPDWSFAGPEYPGRDALLAERDRMIAKHPGTTFMCVHFGNNPEDLDAVDRLLTTYPNVVIDTAARLGEIGRHPPERVRAFFIKHQDRILFGTDIGLAESYIMLGSTGEDEPTADDVKPFYDAHWRFFEGKERGIAHPTPIQGRWTIDAINLPEPVLNKLYYANAARIFQLGDTSVAPVSPPPEAPATPDGALNKKPGEVLN